MLSRRLFSALPVLLVLASAPAWASSKEEKKGDGKQVGQYVDLQPVGLPIVVDGELVNYVFVSVRMNLAPNTDTSRWRAKEPFFRDALVRAAHTTPFTVPNDYEKIDAPRLTAALMRSATAITGPGVVRSITVTSQVPSRRARSSSR